MDLNQQNTLERKRRHNLDSKGGNTDPPQSAQLTPVPAGPWLRQCAQPSSEGSSPPQDGNTHSRGLRKQSQVISIKQLNCLTRKRLVVAEGEGLFFLFFVNISFTGPE